MAVNEPTEDCSIWTECFEAAELTRLPWGRWQGEAEKGSHGGSTLGLWAQCVAATPLATRGGISPVAASTQGACDRFRRTDS